ncbi:MAG: serine/threonine-protein kinase [Chloroflexota bacterium]
MALHSGDLLQQGRYSITSQLGRGGMGMVYLGIDRNLLDRLVAIKENNLHEDRFKEQFLREARLLSRLNHPNLPRVTDYFAEPSGYQYLVMDYVEGADLQAYQHSQNSPIDEIAALTWMGAVMDALAYMHNWTDTGTGRLQPIIHRDIKPSNIKVTPTREIFLVDFGLAKHDMGGDTRSGARGTTSGYSSIEQYDGGTGPRSDIYSLGATLYTLVTNQRPPSATDIASGTPLTPPRIINPALSANTERVILQAMQIQAGDRFQSVEEMRDALSRRSIWRRLSGQFVASPGKANPPLIPGWLGTAAGFGMLLFIGLSLLILVPPLRQSLQTLSESPLETPSGATVQRPTGSPDSSRSIKPNTLEIPTIELPIFETPAVDVATPHTTIATITIIDAPTLSNHQTEGAESVSSEPDDGEEASTIATVARAQADMIDVQSEPTTASLPTIQSDGGLLPADNADADADAIEDADDSPDGVIQLASPESPSSEKKETAIAKAIPTSSTTAVPTLQREPTPTRRPPTRTPTSTARPTSTATPEFSSSDAASDSAPSAKAGSTPDPSQLIRLVSPISGSSEKNSIRFEWDANFELEENQAFELVFWKPGDDPLRDGLGLAGSGPRTSAQVSPKIAARYGFVNIDLLWGVRLVQVEPYEPVQFLGGDRIVRFEVGSSSNGGSSSGSSSVSDTGSDGGIRSGTEGTSTTSDSGTNTNSAVESTPTSYPAPDN